MRRCRLNRRPCVLETVALQQGLFVPRPFSFPLHNHTNIKPNSKLQPTIVISTLTPNLPPTTVCCATASQRPPSLMSSLLSLVYVKLRANAQLSAPSSVFSNLHRRTYPSSRQITLSASILNLKPFTLLSSRSHFRRELLPVKSFRVIFKPNAIEIFIKLVIGNLNVRLNLELSLHPRLTTLRNFQRSLHPRPPPLWPPPNSPLLLRPELLHPPQLRPYPQ